jgi:hypothetical protein
VHWPAAALVSVIIALLFSACSTTVRPPALPPPLAAQWESAQLIEAMRQRRDRLRSVRALARVNYAGPEGKQGFEEAVLVQRPDRLRLETLTMLGAILIVTANDREMIGYYPREGVMVRGRASKENLLRYTQIPLELDEITALLAGLPPVAPSAPYRQEGNVLTFSPNGIKRDTLTFASKDAVPTKWERFNGNGAVEIMAQFADYIATPAGLFPSRIYVEAPAQNRKLDIRFQEPELNGAIPAESFSQTTPPHVQEIPIEAIGS